MSKLYISMYHYTRDIVHSRYPQIKGLDTNLFRQQIEYMKNNFNIVTMEQVIDAVEGKSELSEKALLLTFDDGYIDNYTFAFPILEEFGIQGSFFIPGKTFTTHQLLDVNKIHYILASADICKLVEDVKKEMDYYRGIEFDYAPTDDLFNEYAVESRFDIKETIFVKRMLKRHGMFIGLHGYDHYWLGKLPKEQMKKDLDKALDTLDEFIDRKHWVMNYPYGSYNQDVLDYIKMKGACVGFTTEVKIADICMDAALELPRLDCNDFPPKSENYKLYDI